MAWYLPISWPEFRALTMADRADLRAAADEWIEELNANNAAPTTED